MLLKIKKLVENNFRNLAFFYRYLRYRLPFLLAISITVGFLDGLGLSMFIPLLQTIADQGVVANPEQMGNFAFVIETIQSFGLGLTLTVILITMLIFFTLKGAFKWLEQYLSVVFKQYFTRKIRVDYIVDLAEYSYDSFVLQDAGRIQNTMSGEAGRVVNAYISFSRTMQHGILVTTYTFLAFLANAEFAALIALGAILTNFLFQTLYKYTKKLSLKITEYNNSFQGLLIQQIAHFKYLKATGLIESYANKLKSRVVDIESVNRKIGIIDSAMQGVREPLMVGIVVVVILLQINFLGGELTTMLLSILFFYRALTSVMQLQSTYNNFLSFTGSLENTLQFNKDLKSGKEVVQGKKFSGFKDKISLENISFSYGRTKVLENISLNIEKNETIAFVGQSGSGKTTLLNILAGLLKPNFGEVCIDGTNFTKIKTDTFQEKIGYITQEPVIFTDTIFNNVTFWDEKNEVNISRFNDALRKANIFDFVYQLKVKEETLLGQNGLNLSGGQKQRLSIARELYKEVDFLFMDEATSALDSETEKSIQSNIESLQGKYTIIIIAHRLSTLKNADRVVMLSEGRVENVDSYKGLMKKSKNFKKMVELQGL